MNALPLATLGSVSQHWIGTAGNPCWSGGGSAFGQTWNGSSTKDGWLVGAGVEYGFKPHWTVRLEYDYLALANWTSATVPAVSLNRDVQMVKAGINYKFESGVSKNSQFG